MVLISAQSGYMLFGTETERIVMMTDKIEKCPGLCKGGGGSTHFRRANSDA